MEFIRVTQENLEREHICCAISGNGDCQVASKKTWMKARLEEGLVFLKADARGKCFIEYLPAEYAWAPVDAPGYMYIDCFWVSGQMKGHGYGNHLLQECIRDSREKGKEGLVILSSDKKLPYLSDKRYLEKKGFMLADRRQPYFELLYLPFLENSPVPQFKKLEEKRAESEDGQNGQEGFQLFYTRQCPFTAKYAPLIEKHAAEKGIKFRSTLIETCEDAQRMPVPFTSYALFYQGQFVTHEILSLKKFEKIAEKYESREI